MTTFIVNHTSYSAQSMISVSHFKGYCQIQCFVWVLHISLLSEATAEFILRKVRRCYNWDVCESRLQQMSKKNKNLGIIVAPFWDIRKETGSNMREPDTEMLILGMSSHLAS